MRRIRGAAAVALLAFATAATAAHAHDGGGTDYTSEIRAVVPADAGLTVDVLDRDDRLALRNDSGETVVVEGYDGEPYARLRPDGTVEVNLNSPALYLNKDRFAKVDLAAAIVLGAVALGGLLLAVVVRRRRRGDGGDPGVAKDAEAW